MTSTKKITFQFDDNLPYQKDAIDSVVELFRGIIRKPSGVYVPRRRNVQAEPIRNLEIVAGTRLLDNLQKIQMKGNLFPVSEIEKKSPNFTVEMETGTGKTYVYLRTILELHKEYGFNKFMIVVPSIAIRMGVEKSIQMLCDHFKPHYDGLDIIKHSFVYDSKKLQAVRSRFVASDCLSICLINSQAFASDATKIRSDDEYGENLWEDIKTIRPVVIIDEPQKIEGAAKKKSKTLEILESLAPVFTLRYSATHRQLYNPVYKLDSYDAFAQNLVKRIEVKTVQGTIDRSSAYIRYVNVTPDLKAKIEIFTRSQGGVTRLKTFDVLGGDSLHELSGKLPQYRNMRINEDPYKNHPLKIDRQGGLLELHIGESTESFLPDDATRIQIRLTIEKHLEKQFALLDKGEKIKVLSLFFIDSVAKVRSNSGDGRGEYLQIFDEEYTKAIVKFKAKFQKYKELFPQHNEPQLVREGYFARDAKNTIVDVEGWDSAADDGKVKKKSQEDIDRGIELILEKKDELISFDTPLAFIFSHSALREGWDNPNVFVLCTLKGSGSDIAKKQEIGRGLRLPVNTDGNRSIDPQTNELTVIANDFYDHFAENLQRDFNENIGFNKDEATPSILLMTLKDACLPTEKITTVLVDTFRDELQSGKIISVKNVLTQEAEKVREIEFADETLREHGVKIKESFVKLMREKGTRKLNVKNGDNPEIINGRHDYVTEEIFADIFKQLSEKLAKRAIFRLKLNKEKFIAECISELNNWLSGKELRREYTVSTGSVVLEEKAGAKVEHKSTQTEEQSESVLEMRSDFALVNELMYHTNLPRLAILRILRGLDRKELLCDQDLFDIATRKIADRLQDAKAQSIYEYEVITGYEFDTRTIFETDTVDEEMVQREKRIYETNPTRRRALNKYYRTDSDGEFDFARSLEEDDDVLLFTKLRRGGFVIETPYGHYSPDWAIVYRRAPEEIWLYFVIETKFEKQRRDLTLVEEIKIKCGELHFKAVSDVVEFHWVNSYAEFKSKAKRG